LPIPTETEPRRHACSECRSERYGIRSQSIPHGVLMSLHRRIGRTWHKRGFINPRVEPVPSLSAHGPGCAQGDGCQNERRRGASSANAASAMAASRRAPTWHISERSNPARRGQAWKSASVRFERNACHAASKSARAWSKVGAAPLECIPRDASLDKSRRIIPKDLRHTECPR
jgi:hypothetical protein